MKMEGTLSLAMAIMEPGRLLSQPASVMMPSKHSARVINSMESLTAMAPNSKGVPPPMRTPSLTLRVRRWRLRLQGVTSLKVLAMPTMGR